MIEVEHLTKHYPGVHAVRDVTFSVKTGEVVGFLGPNGAGKSTTMRILAGYISPTGGVVNIGGLDVTRDSLKIRRQLGYLPESCALYMDMRVKEYLRYRGQLKGIPGRHLKSRVERVMEQCGLLEVRRRSIGKLSKGFRQRVGIADALVHNPDLLILDEPTIGLDPNQIVHIRTLIQELAQDHTILLSTHILSEVEATCDRVIVLQQGEIVESARLDELESRWCKVSNVHVEARCVPEDLKTLCKRVEGLRDCNVVADGDWSIAELTFARGEDPRETLFQLIREKGWDLRELHREKRSLEEVFVNMTSGNRPMLPEEETAAALPETLEVSS
ncbi:MAG: ATP-binding cassette domain-containing protein [Verrucomicrobia bacterium]|nr:ATP-binding cassette domain-containing protein [Verrucomicrobiota bacterium]MCH8510384.1 ATP-binding cassette domain-containing protein [Kiritimatiellia bacterium]